MITTSEIFDRFFSYRKYGFGCGFLIHQVLIETTTFYIMNFENHGIM